MRKKYFYAFATIVTVALGISLQSCGNDETVNGHEHVDLGLSVKWATCNVGANSPEEYGDYYEWGGMDTKLSRSFKGRNIGGTRGDVASMKWGGEWRQPTLEELDELIENCTWEWTKMGGTDGMKFTSKKNGKSIFLPAAGCKGEEKYYGAGEYGAYWSSERDDDCNVMYYLSFINDECDTNWRGYTCRSVRPVLGSINEQANEGQDLFEEETIEDSDNTIAQVIVEQDSADHESVDLGLSVKWATCNVGASVPEEFGHYYGFGETLPSDSSECRSIGSTDGEDLGDISGDAMYDVARASWGGEWRLPTKAEWVELIDNCTWTSIKIGDERYGMRATSKKNGKSIILPACFDWHGVKGYDDPYTDGHYWSSTPYVWSSEHGVMMYFLSSDFIGITWQDCEHIGSVRPVKCPKHVSQQSTSVSETSEKDNVHDYVDLGLSVKWATCNIGASNPEDFGNHYAWGEIVPYNYNWNRQDNINELDDDISGDPRYDAARANWGKKWRMPTTKEYIELIENCEWKWVRINGMNGMRVTSKKNGNSIFLPAARHFGGSQLYDQVCFGYYWSSSHGDLWTDKAYYLYFDYSLREDNPVEIGWYWTCIGGSIRPVSDNPD